ncbi:hypothetical protein A9261_15075 [Vibrio tasmaniensis]|nr:hypothetical protein A9261_15075 [Vibrio tasmaniensis]
MLPETKTITKDIYLNGDAWFEFDSLELQINEDFDKLVRVLGQYDVGNILVTGHTDSSGPVPYNQILSKHRAQTVANYLIKRGIEAERITVIGMGENLPIADNHTKEGRAKNRRVEIEFETTEQLVVKDTEAL